jgi:hypothetical protein
LDVRIKAFQEATDTFTYLARLDLAALKQKLGLRGSQWVLSLSPR